MLIRSQDKRYLVDMTGTTIEISHNGMVLIAYGNNQTKKECVVLGVYASEQKATAVLDMIASTYESSCVIESYTGDAPYMAVNSTVFQMPQST